ncbi:phenylacetate--CoA ligase family protein [Streptomyces sp. NBC_01294]|uniref:phenylacetate--CoA ligase family protein n=1 Tax=Streptomyces sp. NBC_01294 TaxID=2903815 RepID=UPI002DD92464|nr:phenylacetate--CoA ligase family protein [Streptomyces sp. NBC_01294]WRZ61544.1 phenylacetate--CoA ligase family protein [Streptomyces sp. NBC_01294]
MSAQQLSDLIRFARHNSPFYRDLYASLPPHADRLTDLPVVDQQEFWAANTLHDNRVLTGPLSEATVYKTGGTTGSAKFSVYTRDEWRTFVTSFGQGLVDAGLRPGHRVADLFYAGELYASFLFVLDSLAHAPVDNVRLPIGGGAPLESTIPTLRDLAAQVLAGTPTTLCRLAEHVVSIGARLDSVELLLFGGEALFDDQRRLLAAAFPRAEARSGRVRQRRRRPARPPRARLRPPGRIRALTPYSVVEILDDSTDEPITEPGRPGRVVVTSLFRRLMPIIRYPACRRPGRMDRAPGPGHFRILGRAEEGVRAGSRLPLHAGTPRTPWPRRTPRVTWSACSSSSAAGTAATGLVLRLDDRPRRRRVRWRSRGVQEAPGCSRRRAWSWRPCGQLHPDSVRAGFVHPLSVEWARHRDLAVNPRSGKLVRVLDEEADRMTACTGTPHPHPRPRPHPWPRVGTTSGLLPGLLPRPLPEPPAGPTAGALR